MSVFYIIKSGHNLLPKLFLFGYIRSKVCLGHIEVLDLCFLTIIIVNSQKIYFFRLVRNYLVMRLKRVKILFLLIFNRKRVTEVLGVVDHFTCTGEIVLALANLKNSLKKGLQILKNHFIYKVVCFIPEGDILEVLYKFNPIAVL